MHDMQEFWQGKTGFEQQKCFVCINLLQTACQTEQVVVLLDNSFGRRPQGDRSTKKSTVVDQNDINIREHCLKSSEKDWTAALVVRQCKVLLTVIGRTPPSSLVRTNKFAPKKKTGRMDSETSPNRTLLISRVREENKRPPHRQIPCPKEPEDLPV